MSPRGRTPARTAAILLLPALLAWTGEGRAGTPLEYTVTLKKFELKNNTGQWLTVIEPDRSVNLAEEEARISFFNTAGRVPDGNYINFRITLSETVRVQGRDEIHVTKEGGSVELTGDAVSPDGLEDTVTGFVEHAPSLADAGAPGAMKVRFNFNPEAGRDDAITLTRKNDFPDPLVVRKGSFIYALVLVELEGAVRYAQKHHFRQDVPDRRAMFAWPVRTVEEIKLTVDDRSVLLGPGEILIQY